MDNIKWEDGAVCFGNGKQWYFNDGGKHNRPLVNIVGNEFVSFDFIIGSDDFQLNEIRQGDYIEASELDTEQKYNDAVEVFGLFGFALLSDGNDFEWLKRSDTYKIGVIVATESKLMGVRAEFSSYERNRKITYPQLMAIGKLKRAIIERDNENLTNIQKYRNKIDDYLNPTESIDELKDPEQDWSDKHYNHFYQLSEDDIKAGQIKVDAYFVNRMWKINSWEDTGAGFHILKTLPRIANNKNSLKRELVALKKQIDMLCKLHGVDGES